MRLSRLSKLSNLSKLSMRQRIIIVCVLLVIATVLIGFAITPITNKLHGGEGSKNNNSHHNNVIPYYRVSDDLDTSKVSIDMIKTINDVGVNAHITFEKVANTADYNKATFFLFETLNDVDNALKRIKFPMDMKYVYGVAGSDNIASKSSLAYVLRTGLPKSVVERVMPRTYILELDSDVKRLMSEHSADANKQIVYVMKKNVQQQKGFLMTTDIDEVLRNRKDYVVVQRMLQDPFLVNGHKINMRVYMLIVVRPSSRVEFYYYNDGFMYYTIDPFRAGSTKTSEVITTGLSGRDMYADKPLTHGDLFKWLGVERAAKLRRSMTELIAFIRAAYEPSFMEENRFIPGTKFLIYGVDVAPNAELECSVMEVNKGPDLSYKDERDRDLKLRMVHDALCVAGLIPCSKRHTNGFLSSF